MIQAFGSRITDPDVVEREWYSSLKSGYSGCIGKVMRCTSFQPLVLYCKVLQYIVTPAWPMIKSARELFVVNVPACSSS